MAFSAVSCVEEMKIQDEITLGRCLIPTDLVAKVVDGEYVEFNWTKSKGSDSFVLELYVDEAMTTEAISPVTIAKEELPYTLHLEADMVYYARVKGVSSNSSIAASKYASFEDPIQTYAIKSSLNPVIKTRTESCLSITWDADPEVDHIRVTPPLGEDKDYTRVEVGADAVEAAAIVVENLLPSVKYTLSVHFKSANRGEVVAWTRPSVNNPVNVSSAEALLQAIADKAENIFVAYSEEPYVVNELVLSAPVAIYGVSTEDGLMPTVTGRFTINDGVSSMHLEAINFSGAAEEPQTHLMTINAAMEINSISVLNCTVDSYQRGIYYDNKGASVKAFTYEDVVVSQIAGSGGDNFDIRQKSVMGPISFTNCTFNDGTRTFVRIDANATVSTIAFDNCTFNNLCYVDDGNNNGLFNIRATVAEGNFTISDCVFLNMVDADDSKKQQSRRSTLVSKQATAAIPAVSNSYFYNCQDRFFVPNTDVSKLGDDEFNAAVASGKALFVKDGSAILADDPCVDSQLGKFNVTSAIVREANAGDPRWFAEYVDIPEDLTQGVTEAVKTWELNSRNFVKKADKDMVRDGIRFYVKNTPINFVKEGFEFTGAASFDKDGLPVDGAIGIKVDKPGSVVISAAEAAAHAHFTVSLDGKISASVAPGAEYQKVTFPNISGEQMIYIYPCAPITMTFLQWTDDVQVLETVLKTPVLSIDKTVVNERAEETVTVSWSPVDFAGSYDVEFDGKTVSVSDTKYEINTAMLSVDEPGADFSVKVSAVPAADDYTRSESQQAEVSFHVKDVPVSSGGGIPSDPGAIETEYKVVFKEDAVNFADQVFNEPVTINKLTIVPRADGKTKLEKGELKFGGASKVSSGNIPSDRYLSFKVTTPGTIHHIAKASGTSGERHLVISLQKEGAEEAKVLYDAVKSPDGDTDFVTCEITEEDLAGATSALTVYVYCTGNAINLKGIGFTPKPVSAGIPDDPAAIETEYKVTFKEDAVNFADQVFNEPATINKLTIVPRADGKTKLEKGELKFGGASKVSSGNIPTDRYLSFKITDPGTIHHIAKASGSSGERHLVISLQKEGAAEAKVLYDAVKSPDGDADYVTCEVKPEDLEGAESALTVYVYCTGNAINLKGIGFTPAQ